MGPGKFHYKVPSRGNYLFQTTFYLHPWDLLFSWQNYMVCQRWSGIWTLSQSDFTRKLHKITHYYKQIKKNTFCTGLKATHSWEISRWMIKPWNAVSCGPCGKLRIKGTYPNLLVLDDVWTRSATWSCKGFSAYEKCCALRSVLHFNHLHVLRIGTCNCRCVTHMAQVEKDRTA